MGARQICLVEKLDLEFEGGSGVLQGAIALGDADGDGSNELAVGTCEGDLFVCVVRRCL